VCSELRRRTTTSPVLIDECWGGLAGMLHSPVRRRELNSSRPGGSCPGLPGARPKMDAAARQQAAASPRSEDHACPNEAVSKEARCGWSPNHAVRSRVKPGMIDAPHPGPRPLGDGPRGGALRATPRGAGCGAMPAVIATASRPASARSAPPRRLGIALNSRAGSVPRRPLSTPSALNRAFAR
jgi:hypothetical protein